MLRNIQAASIGSSNAASGIGFKQQVVTAANSVGKLGDDAGNLLCNTLIELQITRKTGK